MPTHSNTIRYSYTCIQCGKEFRDFHPDRTHCSRACRDEWRRRQIELTCAHCGNLFRVRIYRADTARYCSKTCFDIGRQTKVALNCKQCGKEYRRDPSRQNRSLYCSAKCQADGKRTGRTTIDKICEFCGAEYQCAPHAINRSRFCSTTCRSSWVVKTFHRHTSSIELIIADLLAAMDLSYRHQERIGQYVCDFFLPDTNVIIECDGEYWHTKDLRVIFRDTRKDQALATLGYKVIRLPESKITTDLAWCRRTIRRSIKITSPSPE